MLMPTLIIPLTYRIWFHLKFESLISFNFLWLESIFFVDVKFLENSSTPFSGFECSTTVLISRESRDSDNLFLAVLPTFHIETSIIIRFNDWIQLKTVRLIYLFLTFKRGWINLKDNDYGFVNSMLPWTVYWIFNKLLN